MSRAGERENALSMLKRSYWSAVAQTDAPEPPAMYWEELQTMALRLSVAQLHILIRIFQHIGDKR